MFFVHESQPKYYNAGMLNIYLEEPVEGNPEQEDVSKELHQMKNTVDNPVSQPLCVVILLLALNCLDAKQCQ